MLLAADTAGDAASAMMQTRGGYGYDAECDVERKFRETRLLQVAPISTDLILSYVGEHVLGLPRSFLWMMTGIRQQKLVMDRCFVAAARPILPEHGPLSRHHKSRRCGAFRS